MSVSNTTNSQNSAALVTTREQAPQLLCAQRYSALAMLPTDAILKIMSDLNLGDISSCSLTCKGFNALAKDNYLWGILFNRRFSTPLKSDQLRIRFEAYKKQHLLNSNLTNGVYALRTLEGHKLRVRSLLFAEDKLISCSDDETIKIWDLETGTCLKTLKGHEKWISSLIFAEGKLISGSADETIKIWDLETGTCLKTLTGHKPVLFLIFAEGKLISGSDDIEIWDLETGTCLKTLKGREGRISSLIFAEGKLIFCSDDSTIEIWDVETGTCLKTLEGLWVRSLLFAEGKLISGSSANTIRIWDLETGARLKTLKGHKGTISSLIFAEGKLISGSDDSTIKIWDLETGTCLKTLTGHKGWISSLIFAEGKLISGSADKTIRIWDFSPPDKVNLIANFKEAINKFSSPFCEDDLALSTTKCSSPIEVQKLPSLIEVSVECNTGYENSLVLCGNGGGLSWNPSQGKPLNCHGENKWTISIPSDVKEFKLVLKTKNGAFKWEKLEGNHSFSSVKFPLKPKF
jgi:WD40 repeat protein